MCVLLCNSAPIASSRICRDIHNSNRSKIIKKVKLVPHADFQSYIMELVDWFTIIMMLYTMTCIASPLHTWMLVEMQHNTRIDSDFILVFLCIGFLHLIAKKLLTNLSRNFCVLQASVTQGLVSLCDPALRLITLTCPIAIHYNNYIKFSPTKV